MAYCKNILKNYTFRLLCFILFIGFLPLPHSLIQFLPPLFIGFSTGHPLPKQIPKQKDPSSGHKCIPPDGFIKTILYVPSQATQSYKPACLHLPLAIRQDCKASLPLAIRQDCKALFIPQQSQMPDKATVSIDTIYYSSFPNKARCLRKGRICSRDTDHV